MTHKNAHLTTLSDEKSGTIPLKALKTGFVENKGQSDPLPVVSTTQGSWANVSCQLNFRLFVSCQLTSSRPSNNSPFKQSYFSLSIIRALPYGKVQIMRVLLLKSVCGCQWNTRGTKALLKVLKHQKKNLTPGNVTISSKDILVLLYDGNSIIFTVAFTMEGIGFPTMWGSIVAKKPRRILPNPRSASKKTVKMLEIILIST